MLRMDESKESLCYEDWRNKKMKSDCVAVLLQFLSNEKFFGESADENAFNHQGLLEPPKPIRGITT